jgi:hypothetical protein
MYFAKTGLARPWQTHGKYHEAYLHAPIFGWFTEGFDTKHLKEVKWLLHELACPINRRATYAAKVR